MAYLKSKIHATVSADKGVSWQELVAEVKAASDA
jgi:hypothetical protein